MSNILGMGNILDVVADFLERTSRELSTPSEAYSDYVVEGLQSCSRSLVDILDILSASNTSSFSAPEIAVLEGYRVNVGEIIVVVRSLLQQWEVHTDGLQTAAIDYSYRAPTVLSRGRGRPRFDMGRGQLVYLSSLNFTWNSISVTARFTT